MRRFAIPFAAIFLAAGAPGIGLTSTAAAQSDGPFMLFFDRGSTDVSPQGRMILDNAAEAYRAGDNARMVMIAGHSDTASEPAVAVRESLLRANNVRDYLVSKGIPTSVITTEAFGATRPLVETPDGVSEPQNRRVEITFGPGSGW